MQLHYAKLIKKKDNQLVSYIKQVIITICFLITNFAFAQETLSRSKIDTTWWYDSYIKGINFISQNDLHSAEKEFQKILNSDDEVAYAYYGLGMVYDKLEKGSKDAEENLREAVDLDPDLIDAHYYLGFFYEDLSTEDITHRQDSRRHFKAVTRINPHFIDGWIEWARVTEKFYWPPHSEPAEILAEGLKVNPENKELYHAFKNSVFWHSQEEEGIPTFNFMIKKFPSDPSYPTDLAKALFNLDEYSNCIAILDTIESTYSNFSPCSVSLLRAKIEFNSGYPEKGIEYYLYAIENIKDHIDVNSLFSDLRYIMNDVELLEFESTPISGMSSFFSRFWLSRDPNLATTENERISEHFRRLNYARKNYRRYLTSQKENELLYQFEHPLNGIIPLKLGDNLLSLIVTRALPVPLDIDDRGLIFIRHGEPDRWAEYHCVTCPQNFSWLYFARRNRPELVFHFRKHAAARGWFLESVPYAFTNRGDFGGSYAQLDPTFMRIDDMPDRVWRYKELNVKNMELAKIGLHTETADYSYENTLIEFPLKYVSFKSTDSKTNVDLFFGIEGSDLKLNTTESQNNIDYKKFIGFFDMNWNEAIRINKDVTIPLNISPMDWENSGFIDIESFSVLPGKYHCEIQLYDKISNNLGVYKGFISIPDYWKNELMISDIILSGPVNRIEGISKFKKGNVEFDPHMFSAFEKEATVGLYFEIYNLLYDHSDRTKFEVTWLMQESGNDETEGGLMQSTIPYSGKSRDDKIYFNLKLTDIDSGEYELIISVKDIISKAKVRKKIRLSVM